MEEKKPKVNTPLMGKEITPREIWKTMSIKKYADTFIVTEVCQAGLHTIVRTIVQRNGEITGTDILLVPNFGIKETKTADDENIVVFTREVRQ